MRFARLVPTLAMLVISVGCTSVTYGPAGYERKSVPLPRLGSGGDRKAEVIVVQAHELRFDEELRLYRVTDLPDHYYSAGWFYRPGEAGWERARGIDGNWATIPTTETPPTLLSEPADPP